jgi:hypothetical protein
MKLIELTRLRAAKRMLKMLKTLGKDLGYYRSVVNTQSCDGAGLPVPWITYPALAYLEKIELSDKRVFEYGSGNSTLYWHRRAKSITAVENHPRWHKTIKERLPQEIDYMFRSDPREYAAAIHGTKGEFDVIVVDGSYRYDCAVQACPKLAPDGFMIVDNSDWLANTCNYLREFGLIEIDMDGFGPINGFTWTTSFFFTRNVSLRPRQGRQPAPAIGSIPSLYPELDVPFAE